MRNVLALSLLAAAAATSLAACDLPIGGCGGYTGGNDRVLARGNDAMILCENGGFVVNLASGNLEGRYELDAANTDVTHATMTDTAEVAFTLTENTDGTASAPELGATEWTELTLDQVALDHANTQCTNLEARAWWGQSAPALAVGAKGIVAGAAAR